MPEITRSNRNISIAILRGSRTPETVSLQELGFDDGQYSAESIKNGKARIKEVFENLSTKDTFGAIGNPYILWNGDYRIIIQFNKEGCQVHTPTESKTYGYDYKTVARQLAEKKGLGNIQELDPRVILTTKLVAYEDQRWVTPQREFFVFELPNEPNKKAVLHVSNNLPLELKIYNAHALNLGKIDDSITYSFSQ